MTSTFPARVLLVLLAVFALVGASGARAENDAASWRIVQSIGDVTVAASNATIAKPKPGTLLPDAAVITTGTNGRAILSRQEQQIVLQPNSRLELAPDSGQRTVMRQLGGIASFRVDRKKAPHFEVNTPFLAAVVKGTQFEIRVDDTSAEVKVSQGKVEVRSATSAATTLVTPGGIASISQDAPDVIRLKEQGGKTRNVTTDEGGLEGDQAMMPRLRTTGSDTKAFLDARSSGDADVGNGRWTPKDLDAMSADGKRRKAEAARLAEEKDAQAAGNEGEVTIRLGRRPADDDAAADEGKDEDEAKDKDADDKDKLATAAPATDRGDNDGGKDPKTPGGNGMKMPGMSSENSFLKTQKVKIEGDVPWREVGYGALALLGLFLLSALGGRMRKRRERDRYGSNTYT